MTGGSEPSSNVVRFPGARPAEAGGVELLARLAPPRSFVAAVLAERGEAAVDLRGLAARQMLLVARALRVGFGADEAVLRMRRQVDGQVADAIEVCRGFGATADRLAASEREVARSERPGEVQRAALRWLRSLVADQAIAADAVAEAAHGAVGGLAQFVLECAGDEVAREGRQLLLFG